MDYLDPLMSTVCQKMYIHFKKGEICIHILVRNSWIFISYRLSFLKCVYSLKFRFRHISLYVFCTHSLNKICLFAKRYQSVMSFTCSLLIILYVSFVCFPRYISQFTRDPHTMAHASAKFQTIKQCFEIIGFTEEVRLISLFFLHFCSITNNIIIDLSYLSIT